MIKSIYSTFLFRKNLIHIVNKRLNFFSTKSLPQKDKVEDWQYVQHIMRQIKDNRVNDALGYLIQSHLNNKILNKQIYYSLSERMLQSQMTSGYHEILYKLYREHFQPNQMTLTWMKKIASTENMKLSKLLKEDFEKLNTEFPGNSQDKKQSEISQKQTKKQDSVDQQTKSYSVGRKSRKINPALVSTDDYFSSSPQTIKIKRINIDEAKNEKIDKTIHSTKALTADGVQTEIVEKFHEVMSEMFKEYGKVTLHNVQLQIDFGQEQSTTIDDQINEMYNQNDVPQDEQGHDEQNSEQPTMEQLVVQTFSAIKKVKIGKIQFEKSNTLESLKDLRNGLNSDPKNKQ